MSNMFAILARALSVFPADVRIAKVSVGHLIIVEQGRCAICINRADNASDGRTHTFALVEGTTPECGCRAIWVHLGRADCGAITVAVSRDDAFSTLAAIRASDAINAAIRARCEQRMIVD